MTSQANETLAKKSLKFERDVNNQIEQMTKEIEKYKEYQRQAA